MKYTNPIREYKKRNGNLHRRFSIDSYQEFLESNYWKLLKEYGFSQPESRWCFFCRSEKGIVLHHVKYTKIYHPSLKYILPVCHDCHSIIHEINFNKDNNADVLKSTEILAHEFRINERIIKKLGVKTFYRKFWSCGLRDLDSPEMKEELAFLKRGKKKKV